ncbi:DUF1062 domain-containing protein [Klebsiella sp. RHBSTW-00484]|uniref:DUF1062 domain-containing protein n=1 Tax=unclassified Klebsiella TaxID=2608929 RepID=UPI0015E57FC8|nr:MULTISPECIES: DUF1062 domain-containing protein [unclassified Klebsiella]MBA7847100.1 DUF1062 domain-containing protein [Klebsiella sp. RHBSTW-00465]QLO36996.1 DUF1062 domain-containing protein [Klebsiella sp. RHBSTW-00484]QLT76514.1 DUF1062 domain-containing protein [Klebsiella sp. RHBSTW-00464]
MKVTWNVSPVGYQLISKRCPSCHGAQDFTPSGSFRINSQKKVLDVWSIYKCVRCAYTWNISLFSRLPIGKINPQLYGQLVANAESAVQHYSHDLQVLRRNGATLSGSPEFVVEERWQISLLRTSLVRVRVRLERTFQVSLLAVLRSHLGLSGNEIRKRLDSGDIVGITLKTLKARRLRPEGYTLYIATEVLLAHRRIPLSAGADLRRK